MSKKPSSIAGLTALVLGLFALTAYFVLGWHAMDTACSQDTAVPPGVNNGSVQFGWSWNPLGFQCEWTGDAGEPVTVTKLWW